MCAGGFRGHKSSNNWIISICSRFIGIFLICVSSALEGVGQVGGRCPGWPTIVYMSSGVFRGKESSNRIELSWLVKDLLNFGDLGSLQLWWMGVFGGCPTCMHCTHDNFMQMAAPLDFWGIPGNSLWCHMHMHVCGCACGHVWGHPLTTPYCIQPTPPTPRGDPQNQ